MKNKLHEECAVFGVSVKSEDAAGIVYNGLLALQHRGQEGAGIAVLSRQAIKMHKDMGLVSEVFHGERIIELSPAHLAIGHTRYSTTGNNTKENVQPFVTEYLTGRIAMAHNGNITNAKALRDELFSEGIDFVASSDSEVVSALIAYYIVKKKDTIEGIIAAAKELQGAFSLIVMTSHKQLIAIRDRHGFRPLCIGENEAGMVIASESCALDSCGFHFVKDIRPGEIVVIEDGKETFSEKVLDSSDISMCIFEYVYFARQDSVLDHQSVYKARFEMGRVLAREAPVEADAVCGVPDSGLEAAVGYAEESGLPLISGFAKNRYIGRSFIFPSQAQRENAVKLKLNPMRVNIEGKRIVLIDDSIVRGTTSANIVRALKEAGAKEVHMRISSPPFRFTCYFGTDIDNEENLIANRMSLDDIRKQIGADSIAFISVNGLKNACADCSLEFCTRCFTGYEKNEHSNCNKRELEG
jgi:amidophosphoribosyltransferase